MRLGFFCAVAVWLFASSAAWCQDERTYNFEACRDLWEATGLPTYNADEELDVRSICHQRYAASHNNLTRTPDWVFERLTKSQVTGSNDRPNVKFSVDPQIKGDPDARSAQSGDYAHSDFAIGHQAPSEDFNRKTEWMKESFYFSNAVPQIGPGFNGGVWSGLEKRVRTLVKGFRGSLYVVTGPVPQIKRNKRVTIKVSDNACGQEVSFGGDDNRPAICGDQDKCPNGEGVAVPAALFKIIYDPDAGRLNAFLLPNIDHRGKYDDVDEYLETFRVSLALVEQYTGLTFFPTLGRRRSLVQQCAVTMWH